MSERAVHYLVRTLVLSKVERTWGALTLSHVSVTLLLLKSKCVRDDLKKMWHLNFEDERL